MHPLRSRVSQSTSRQSLLIGKTQRTRTRTALRPQRQQGCHVPADRHSRTPAGAAFSDKHGLRSFAGPEASSSVPGVRISETPPESSGTQAFGGQVSVKLFQMDLNDGTSLKAVTRSSHANERSLQCLNTTPSSCTRSVLEISAGRRQRRSLRKFWLGKIGDDPAPPFDDRDLSRSRLAVAPPTAPLDHDDPRPPKNDARPASPSLDIEYSPEDTTFCFGDCTLLRTSRGGRGRAPADDI